MNLILENLLSINFYLFNSVKFLNKILFEKMSILKLENEENFFNYYLNLKKTLKHFNPFYGTKINTYSNKIKINMYVKKKKENKISLYRNFLNYKIPFKDLTYIFNLSIEKLRIEQKKNV